LQPFDNMPYIPLPAPGQVALPKRPALDTENRPQVKDNGVIAAMGNLGEAAQQPLVDAAPFVAAAGSLGKAIGGALMETGSFFGVLARKKQDAFDDRTVQEAAAALRMEDDRFELFKEQNPDTTKWGPEVQRGTDSVLKSYSNVKGLSGDGAQRLGLMTKEWAGRRGLHAEISAIKHDNQRTASAYQANIEDALDRRNFPEAARLAKESEDRGYSFPHQTQKVLSDAQKLEQSDQIGAFITANPGEAAKRFREGNVPWNLGEQEKMQWAARSELEFSRRESAYVEDIVTARAEGLITKPDDVNEWKDRLRPSTLAHLKADIAKGMPKNLNGAWAKAYDRIQELDLSRPDVDWRREEAELRTDFDLLFDGPTKSEINDILTDKIKEFETGAESGMKEVAEIVKKNFDREMYGVFKRPKTNAMGQVLVDEKKQLVVPRDGDIVNAKEETVREIAMVEDEVKKEEALGKVNETLKQLERWRKTQKTPPTRDELLNKFNEISEVDIVGGEAELFLNGGKESSMLQFLNVPATEAEAAFRKEMGIK
jgi:hypothetical protein